MHAVDANDAGTTVGSRCPALADRDARRPGLGEDTAAVDVTLPLAQVVQVPHRDRRQPLVTDIAKDVQRVCHEVPCGRARQGVVQAVGLCQQGDVDLGEAAHEPHLRRPVGFRQFPRTQTFRHQSRQLLPRVARRPFQVAQHQTLASSPRTRVPKSPHHTFDVAVALVVSAPFLKLDLSRSR